MEIVGLYGYLSGLASSLILQPFDNIKMVLILPPNHLAFTNNPIRNACLSVRYLANE